jgi:hypothetical protein
MLYHPPPKCGWNSELRCAGCGKPRGYRYTDDDSRPATTTSLCWACANPGLSTVPEAVRRAMEDEPGLLPDAVAAAWDA